MMHYVGVDLAWGPRRRTGLAALDGAGVLQDLGEVRDDAELLAWLWPWASGPCLVAIDAPIVVRNPTGQRAAERLVTRHFGRFHAGAHPSNTSRAPFLGGDTRALRLASALDLDVDPAAASPRRAIEVYPHPATIALFGLSSVLRYKHKRGRDLAVLRSELMRLVQHLEALEQSNPPLHVREHAGWQRVRQHIETAPTKAALRAVEDVVDAVLCAYIARYADARPELVRVLGTAEDGYILTPVTPALAQAIDADDA